MKLAILDAVPKKYWHVDNDYTDAEKFIELLTRFSTSIKTKAYFVAENQWPESVHDYDGFVISGSPCSVNDDADWIKQLIELIQSANCAEKKLVGICFGHQLIAKTLGGKVCARVQGWRLGLHAVNLVHTPHWMSPQVERVNLYHINREEVVALPEGATRYASSEYGQNDGYLIKDNIFCIQGHPEQPQSSMLNFIADIKRSEPGTAIFDQAIHSIKSAKPDKAQFANWIVQFLIR